MVRPPYRPDGFHSVTPYLMVHGAAALIEFLKRAFGAEEVSRTAPDNDIVRHAHIRIGDSNLELSEQRTEWPAVNCVLHYYVPDVDEVYRTAMDAGATSLYEPIDQPYGDREAGVKDPAGNQWFIAGRIA